MPLLNKKPLELHRYNKKLKDDAEVFYCKCTNEIFEDYEEYCQRIISCNSLIWTCAMTGKSNLTYEEALASEENALKTIKDFPLEIRTPVLYIASKTNRMNFNDLVDDVFNFCKDRYFLGECVEALFDDQWIYGHILQVILPTKEEVEEYCKVNNITAPINTRPYPGPLYKYEVEEFNDEETEDDIIEMRILTGDKLRRVKGIYTKEKNRIYLRQFAEQINGVYRIKKEILDKYCISTIKFSHMFVGEPPVFQESKKSINASKMAQPSIKKFFAKSDSKNNENVKKSPGKDIKKKVEGKEVIKAANKVQKKYQNSIDKVVQQARKDAIKKQALEDKNKKLEQIRLKKEKEKAEKAKLADFVKEWQRKRDDLECEDLKDLPAPIPVNCRIPNEHFGDFIMILEFFNNFKQVLKIKDYFPFGLKFDLVERALVDNEIAGPFCDILQLLLTTLFCLQEQEDDEIQNTGSNNADDLEIDENGDMSTAEAIKLATVAASWCKSHHGVPLDKLSLDAITVSEILRLHLLSSGGRAGEKSSKWRFQERGGYTSTDDPGLLFRLNEPQILKFLAVRSVAELPIEDKLKVLTCLMNQILTYAEVRDIIEERFEKLKTGKNELKNDQMAEAKREKEAAAEKIKQKKEAKEKGETVPEETEEEKLKGEKELNKKKAEFHKRMIQLQKDAMECQVLPLGMDRGYRRFWVFTSLSGLFVEDDERWPGTCLPQPTPNNQYLLNLEEDTMAYVRRLFEEERNCGSDKENEGDSSHPIQSPKKKLLGESNGLSVSLSPVVNKSFKDDDDKPRSLVCTANEETCTVHNRTKNRTKWQFYYKESDIDELINCLNKRGYREHRLRKVLIEEKDRIVPRLKECPVNLLNPCIEENTLPVQNVTKITRSQKFYENANLKYPPGTPIQEILELYIRELILDTEEKIYCGGLGSLKVKDRLAWRDAIEGRFYDKQDDDLTWNHYQVKKEKTIEKIKEEDVSRPDTPCSIDSNSDHDVLANKLDQNQTVRDLASAVLQIARSVEPKYLQKPLTHEKKKDRSSMEKWESSLMCSTSFAQVYLHIATLENSIQWAKSALNARCKVCRKGGDGENMLLCDGCDRGFHLYCLKPKLSSIPKGDWFCLACRPKEKVEKTKRSRRLFSEDSDNDEPLISLRTKRSKNEETSNKRKLRKKDETDEDDDSSDEPLAKIARTSRRSRKSDAD